MYRSNSIGALAALTALPVVVLGAALEGQRVVRRKPAQADAGAMPDAFDAVRAATARAPVVGGQPVLVVDKASGEPIAGASVLAVAQDVIRARPARDHRRELLGQGVRDREQLMLRMTLKFGARYACDAAGIARVPRFERGIVLGVAGRRLAQGFVRVDPDETEELEPVRLELPERAEVDLLVVRADGRPAADVEFSIQRDNFFRQDPDQKTDARGRLSLPVPADTWKAGGKIKLVASVALPAPLQVGVDLGAIQRGDRTPIRVELPPCGELRLFVFDSAGRPVTDRTWVNLEPVLDQQHDAPSYAPTRVEKGVRIFSHVGLGQRLRARTSIPGVAGMVTVEGAGPTREGEIAVLTLEPKAAAGVVTMRLLGVDGEPVANETVGVVTTSVESFDGRQAQTGADGRLSVVLDTEFRTRDDVELMVIRRGPGSSPARYRGAVRIALRERVRANDLALKDVRLVEEPVLLQGRVVDKAGAPMAGAKLSFDPFAGQNFRSRSYSGGGAYWRHEVTTDDEGRFELRDIDRNIADVRLVVRKDGHYVVGSADFTAGARDAKIVLDRGASLVATIAPLPADQHLSGSFKLIPEKPGEAGPRSYDGSRHGRTEVRFQDVPPGTYALEVRIGWNESEKPAYRVAGLELKQGEVSRDPRVQKIDWKKWWQPVKLELVDERGKAVTNASVTVWRRTGEGSWSGSGARTDANGKLTALVAREGGLLEIGADGFLHTWVTELVEQMRLVLPAGVELALRPSRPIELPKDAWLTASFVWQMPAKRVADRPYRVHKADDLRLDPVKGGVATFPAEGRWQCRVVAYLPKRGGGTVERQLALQELTCTAGATDPVALSISDEALAELKDGLAEARGR